MLWNTPYPFFLAFISDLLLGDPEGLPHPVRATGRLIEALDGLLRGGKKGVMEELKGVILFFVVTGITVSGTYLLLYMAKKATPLLEMVLSVYIGYTTIAAKDLKEKAMAIFYALESNDLIQARRRLSMIVGRDTKGLSAEKIISATIESVSENTSDGVIAPMFYLLVGGPVLAVFYKTVNTLDSMVGYKNEKYIHFGWFSARMDDLLNYIPARITGILIVIASFIIKRDYNCSLKTMRRDGKKHPSPNSGIPEAAMAGALRIKLGGPSTYEERIVFKDYIGEGINPVTAKIIRDAVDISMLSSIIFVITGGLLKWIL